MTPSPDSQSNNSQKVDYALLSTTTSLGRVSGFTVELIFHLKDGPKRCRDLVEISGKPHCYVWRYLKNMLNYGLVQKQGVFWNLSDLGVDFWSYLSIVYNNIIEYRKIIERKKKDNRKITETSQPKVVKQVSISLWAPDSPLDKVEREVVEVLVKHYNETGSKFLYFNDVYHFADKFKIRPDQVNQILMNLKQDQIVYSIKDKQHNAWKIGLYKAFIEGLKASQGIAET